MIVVFKSVFLCGQEPKYPFPMHVNYAAEVFPPKSYTQQQLDDSVKTFYQLWKTQHIRHDCPEADEYYILNNERISDGRGRGNICVSEGQGYGMIITVIMAGYDSEAKTIYDGLFRFFKSHPSAVNPGLMTWSVQNGCKSKISGDNNNSATDGDLDIALSLLMADKQWGSKGTVDYKKEAYQLIEAILKSEINPKAFTVLISDALEADDPQYFDTRASDFMPGHFKEFFALTGDSSWLKVINQEYSIFQSIQQKYSLTTGLLPDFIIKKDGHYKPASPKYMESEHDGNYYYNACRVPMRLSMDYFISGDVRAFQLIEKMNRWIRKKTLDNPEKLFSGYYLSGKNIKDNDYSTPAFIAPFAVSALIGSNNRPWGDKLCTYLLNLNYNDFRYYNNTLKMVCLLLISHNFWVPSCLNN